MSVDGDVLSTHGARTREAARCEQAVQPCAFWALQEADVREASRQSSLGNVVCAGDTLERSWLHVSSSLNCGKMKALEQLLQAWHTAGDNKVLSCSLSTSLTGFSGILSRNQ